MQETVEQYKQRLLGYLGEQDPVRVSAATADKIERMIKGVPLAKLRRQPAPGKWSVAEILAHLADNVMVQSYRVKRILAAPGEPIEAYDQDKWAQSQDYIKHDPKLSLRTFRVLREGHLALLKSLRPEQWKLYGIHAERGQESVEQIVRLMAGHDLNHTRQIEAILAPQAKGKQTRRRKRR